MAAAPKAFPALLHRLPRASERFDMSPETFRKLSAAGKLPAPIHIGRVPYWTGRSLVEFVESLENEARSACQSRFDVADRSAFDACLREEIARRRPAAGR